MVPLPRRSPHSFLGCSAVPLPATSHARPSDWNDQCGTLQLRTCLVGRSRDGKRHRHVPVAAIPSRKIETDPAELELIGSVTNAADVESRWRGLGPVGVLPGEAPIAPGLGISRGVVREAFRSLAALHVIDIASSRRPRVNAIDHSVPALRIEHAVETSRVTVRQTLDVRRAQPDVRSVADRFQEGDGAHLPDWLVRARQTRSGWRPWTYTMRSPLRFATGTRRSWRWRRV